MAQSVIKKEIRHLQHVPCDIYLEKSSATCLYVYHILPLWIASDHELTGVSASQGTGTRDKNRWPIYGRPRCVWHELPVLEQGLYMLSEGVFVLTASNASCVMLYTASTLNGNLIYSDSARAVETSKERYERFPLPLAMQGTDICIARTIIISIDENNDLSDLD